MVKTDIDSDWLHKSGTPTLELNARGAVDILANNLNLLFNRQLDIIEQLEVAGLLCRANHRLRQSLGAGAWLSRRQRIPS